MFGMRSAGSVLAVAALALIGCSGPAGPGVAQELSVPQAVPQAAGGTAFPDFDGDNRADVVFGVGSTQSVVSIAYGSGSGATFGRTDVGGTDPDPENTMGFGQGLLARDLNGDGYTDLVVVDEAQAAGSSIYLVFGSPSGLQPGLAHRLSAPSSVLGFQNTPALVTKPGKLLVVGAAVDSKVAKGGAFVGYPLGADGLPTGSPAVFSQKNLPGTDEYGDTFGSVLAASGSMLLVGAPGEDVGKASDAGAVTVLRYLGGTRFSGASLTQNSKGVAGKAERGDRFGASVAIADGYAAVGVPGEDGAKRDSGAVATFKVSGAKLKPLATITQDSAKVPGKSEANDRFGSAVAVIRACSKGAGLLVGATGEAIGSALDAGSVWVLPLSKTCTKRVQLYEGHGLGGAATEMASVGSAVSALRTSASGADTLVLTAPGISEEGVYGRVLTVSAPFPKQVTTVARDLRLNEEGTIALSPPVG